MCKKIIIQKNGPITLVNIPFILTQNQKELFVDSPVDLCRCGQSFDLPFCDGNHIIFEFSDLKDPYRAKDEVKVYHGEKISIYDNRGICSHRGICYDELPTVFMMNNKTFIDPNGAEVDAIIDICKRCPSGALSFSLPNDTRDLSCEEGAWFVRFAPRRYGFDGPLEVRGSIVLEDPDGNLPESKEHYALCRCGHSKNMPFCSGDHWRVKFIDDSNDEML